MTIGMLFSWVGLILFGVLVFSLLIWQFNRCTLCGTKMVTHKKHWNVKICPKCGKMEVHN